MFFNAPYFRRRALSAIDAPGPDLCWFVLDLIPLTQFDVTGIYSLQELADELKRRGGKLLMAGRRTVISQWLDRRGLLEHADVDLHFPTLRQAQRAYRIERGLSGKEATVGEE